MYLITEDQEWNTAIGNYKQYTLDNNGIYNPYTPNDNENNEQ